jgi:hypothetical protein
VNKDEDLRFDDSEQSDTNFARQMSMNWIEKNLLIAAQTGYSHIINSVTYKQSFLEFQINAALYDDTAFPYYRFYYRQAEYIDEKFAHLPTEARQRAVAMYEAENDYCEFKIKDLKMRIAKKGLVVKYYSTLEQLDAFIYEDFIEMVQGKPRIFSPFSNKASFFYTLILNKKINSQFAKEPGGQKIESIREERESGVQEAQQLYTDRQCS